MTLEALKDCNKRDLAKMARDRGIAGWHTMRKDQLLRALVPPQRRTASRHGGPSTNGSAPRKEASARKSRRNEPVIQAPQPLTRELAHGCVKDRIITMVRDPFWLHVYWELSRTTLSRAQAALGQEWHTARPILRLVDVSSEETSSASERQVRDIPIHGGVNNWYIDVNAPQRSYRIDIGYLSRKGKFYVLARSNVVTMPKAGASDMFDQSWMGIEKDCERIFHQSGGNNPAGMHSALRELFEERLRRPMNSQSLQGLNSLNLAPVARKFHFEIDAELVVYGTTEAGSKVTLQGEPVPVRPDGSFTVRFSLPDARQIIPAVSTSADGVEERTIVLAVERNTKELEPMIHDSNDI